MNCKWCGSVLGGDGRHTNDWVRSWMVDGKRIRPRLYRVLHTMKTRCSNPKNISYPYYGAKGVRVCETWANDYAAFRKWCLGNGYQRKLQIDRRDNTKDYCPANCRWVKQIDNQPRLKLSPDDVRAIRMAKGTNTEIGRQFDVDSTHILRIKRGEKRLDVA